MGFRVSLWLGSGKNNGDRGSPPFLVGNFFFGGLWGANIKT